MKMGAKLSLASKGVPQPSLGTKKRVGLATLFIVMHSILSDNHQIMTILNLQTDSLTIFDLAFLRVVFMPP